MSVATIRLVVEPLEEGGYLATSHDVPGLLAEADSIPQVVAIAQDVAAKIAESCRENGFALPTALGSAIPQRTPIELKVLVGVP